MNIFLSYWNGFTWVYQLEPNYTWIVPQVDPQQAALVQELRQRVAELESKLKNVA